MRKAILAILASAGLITGVATAAPALAAPAAPAAISAQAAPAALAAPAVHQSLAYRFQHAQVGAHIRLGSLTAIVVRAATAKRSTAVRLCDASAECITGNGAGAQMVTGSGADLTVFTPGGNDVMLQTQNVLCVREKTDGSVVGSNGACTSSDNAERWNQGSGTLFTLSNEQHTSDQLMHFGTVNKPFWGNPPGMSGGTYKYQYSSP